MISKNTKNQFKGTMCLLVGTTIWGFAFIAQSVGMDLIGPFTFQTVRCLLAIAFLTAAAFILDKCSFRESCRRWLNKKLWISGLICGVALFIAASLQQVGLVYTDAGKAGFITAMYIVLVPMLGLLLGRNPSRAALTSVGIAVVGLYLLSCVGVNQVNKGDLMLMGCALAFAVQITCIDRYAADLDGIRLNCIQALVVTVLSLPPMMLTETVEMGSILACWQALAFAGILSMGVGYTLQIAGQRHLEPTAASLLMSLESVFAALGGWLLLHETMNGWELAGSALVFSAVIISQLPERNRK